MGIIWEVLFPSIWALYTLFGAFGGPGTLCFVPCSAAAAAAADAACCLQRMTTVSRASCSSQDMLLLAITPVHFFVSLAATPQLLQCLSSYHCFSPLLFHGCCLVSVDVIGASRGRFPHEGSSKGPSKVGTI